jgi:transcription antitermination factor NusG
MTYMDQENPATTGSTEAPPWFAVRVKSNFERTVSVLLEQKGYCQFLPTYQVEAVWSDRTKSVEKILFPGYVFCRFDPSNRLPVLSTTGVLHVVGVGREPAAIAEQEVDAVRAMLQSGLPVSPWPFLQSGDRVVVERGALAGVEGIVTQFKRGYRLIVSITLLQRSVAVEIARDWVRPLGSKVRGFPENWAPPAGQEKTASSVVTLLP